ncbi:MAG: type II toxin-antitoxin system RelE/ParE family toxin [Gammaproteobacteria bacterium]
MIYSFLPEAEAEYLEAVRFYEEQRAGLGDALISEFEHAIGLAAERPESWRLVHPSGIRRIGLLTFPYAVFYRVLSGSLQITAFAHHRHRPGYWLTRVGSL